MTFFCKKNGAIFLILSLSALQCIALDKGLQLYSDKPGAMYTPNETVVFHPVKDTIPTKLTCVTGRVLNSSGKKITEVKVGAQEFLHDGWQWRPQAKGFFRIEFDYKIKGRETAVPATTEYSARIKKQIKKYTRRQYTAAVIDKPLPMAKRSKIMGISDQFESRFAGKNMYLFADMLNFSFSRINSIGWGAFFSDASSAIEPEPGRYNWTELDAHVAELNRYGFEIIGGILYTPAWASPHPEKTAKKICVLEYSAYAPAKTEYLTNFLTKLLERYHDRIRIWEIWNEVNFPGLSCFWMDSTANYLKLNAAAYQTIKKLQPDSEIWLSATYEGFYQVTCRDLYPYYDKFNLHGAKPDPRWFHDIDNANGLKSKPWVCSESHDILVRGKKKISEQALALDMIKNLLFKMKHGVERIAFFSIVNLAEMEALPFYHKNGKTTQASGLFRRQPRLEPRLCAVVMATFNRNLGNDCTYRGEYDWGNGVNGVRLHSNIGESLIVWNGGENEVNLPARLAGLLRDDSVISDWEGNRIDKRRFKMQGMTAYYITGLDNRELNNLNPVKNVLTSDYDAVSSNTKGNTTLGIGVNGKLPSQESASGWWNSDGWKKKSLTKDSAIEHLSARYMVAADRKNFYIRVEVTDANNVVSNNLDRPWEFDSIQFAVDTKSRGFSSDSVEFLLAVYKGRPVLMKSLVPHIGGDLPNGWTDRMLPIKNAVCSVQRLAQDKLLYAADIPWTEFYPLTFDPTRPLLMSVLVNNNDGHGRDGWLEWGGGIGEFKRPTEYGKIFLINNSQMLIPFNSPDWKGWVSTAEKNCGNDLVNDHNVSTITVKPGRKVFNETGIQLFHSFKVAQDGDYLLTFNADASSTGRIIVAMIKPKPPWTRYAAEKVTLAKGPQRYCIPLRLSVKPGADTITLRFLAGLLPTGTYKLSNLALVKISGEKRKNHAKEISQ